MPAKTGNGVGAALEAASVCVSEWVGSSAAFAIAVTIVLLWGLSGPLFHYSDTWQLVINTGTTIITFLMVFLIQRAQNKEAKAVNLKLNELVAAIKGASNRLIDVEQLSEKEILTLAGHYADIARKTAGADRIQDASSIEETTGNPQPHREDEEEPPRR